ncbi:unnamed protein product, partial [Musa hybrid cultivar]
EPATTSGTRVVRESDPEKRRSSNEHSSKDVVGTSNVDFSGEHGKKRKERAEVMEVADRWNAPQESVTNRADRQRIAGRGGTQRGDRPREIEADGSANTFRVRRGEEAA